MTRPLALVSLLAACSTTNEGAGAGAASTDDGQPPAFSFQMDTPATTGFSTSDSLEAGGSVTGSAPVVTVNGADASLSGESWSAAAARADLAWPDSPLFPVLAHATDDDGQWARARATFATGEAADPALVIEDALAARLTDHALDAFGPAIDQLVADLDLGALLVSDEPIATILGADITVTAADFGEVDLALDFRAIGLEYSLSVAPVSASLLLDFGFTDTEGDLAAEQIDVTGVIRLGADAGGLTLTPENTTVSVTGLELFGFNDPTGIVDGLINTFLSDTIAELIEEQVVALADDLFAVLDDLTSLDLAGVTLETTFASVQHDEDGVTLLADTALSVVDGALPAERLANPQPMPFVSGQTTASGDLYGVALLLDDDLLSGIGAALVGTGILNQELSGDLGPITLDTTLLAVSVPGFDTLEPGLPVTLRTRPTLPPLGTAGSAAPEAGQLHIGGLEADFEVEGEVVMTVVLDAVAGVGLGTVDELLLLDVLATDVTLLSTTLGSTPDEVEPGLQSLIELAIPLLVGDLLGDSLDLSGLPIELLPVGSGPVDDRAAVYLDLGDVSGLEL